jgi:signal transduction histidine kinase
MAASIDQRAIATNDETDFAAALESAKVESLYQFAYGLSHEINNPLANIATRAQTLLADEPDPERRRKLATIVQQAFRAHEMIADLMLFARPPALSRAAANIGKLAEQVVEEMQPLAAEQGTRLQIASAAQPLLLEVDATQIAVAIKALLQNALDAVKAGGEVRVSVQPALRRCGDGEPPLLPLSLSVREAEGGKVNPPAPHFSLTTRTEPGAAITIEDNGPGIPPHVRAHLFDPFFSGREAGRGLGLGLSKAWRIVTLHGGRLEVDSQFSTGARFILSL